MERRASSRNGNEMKYGRCRNADVKNRRDVDEKGRVDGEKRKRKLGDDVDRTHSHCIPVQKEMSRVSRRGRQKKKQAVYQRCQCY